MQESTGEPAVKEALPSNHTRVNVFLPGMTGGDIYLTQMRQYFDQRGNASVIIPSSITRSSSLKKGENLPAHYDSIAQNIIQKAKETGVDTVTMVGHSLGVDELMELIKALSRKNPTFIKRLDIGIMSGFGFGEKGIGGLVESIKRVMRLGKEFVLYDQHFVYPLPVEFYQAQKSNKPDTMNALEDDFNEQVENRRDRFLNQWLPELLKDKVLCGKIEAKAPVEMRGDIKKYIAGQLQEYDQRILQETGSLQDQALQERAVFIHDLVQAVFEGKHIPPEIHNQYMETNDELADSLAPQSNYLWAVGQFFARAFGTTRIIKGIDAALADTIKKSGFAGKVVVGFQGRDIIMSPADADKIQEQLSLVGLLNAEYVYLGESAHSTVGYEPVIVDRFFSHIGQIGHS